MGEFEKTKRTTITRLPKRGSYEKETVYAILDEALWCTVAFVRDGMPFQIPTGFCRMDNTIYIHGSVGSFYMRELAESAKPVCISATLIDGLVLARSAFHHSVNYRSVVLFGIPRKVTDNAERDRALEIFTNKVQPGRWDDIRKPNEGEWKATMVLGIEIEDASAKMRSGEAKDDDEDYQLPIWAGIVPLRLQRLDPVPDPLLGDHVAFPGYLKT